MNLQNGTTQWGVCFRKNHPEINDLRDHILKLLKTENSYLGILKCMWLIIMVCMNSGGIRIW